MLDDLALQFPNPRVRSLADAVAAGASVLPDPDLPLDDLEQQGKAVERACAQCHGGPAESNPSLPVLRFHDMCPLPVDARGRFAFAAWSGDASPTIFSLP